MDSFGGGPEIARSGVYGPLEAVHENTLAPPLMYYMWDIKLHRITCAIGDHKFFAMLDRLG
jgi:hypothetical protein